MKISTICLILIINFTQALIGQNTPTENTISVKIVIPVIHEKIDETDYTNPRMTDLKAVDSEASIGVGINIPECKIEVSNIFFNGSYTNERWPHEKINFSGYVSADRRMLLKLRIEKSYTVGDESFLESENCKIILNNLPITHSHLPVADGFCRFDNSISSVEVHHYTYTKTSKSGNYNKSFTRTFTHVNNELLPGLEDAFRFRIKLNMDGPPLFMLYVEDLPQDDPDYRQYIQYLSERQGYIEEIEPNSVAVYRNYDGINDTSRKLTKGWSSLLIIEISKKPGVKVLERMKIDKIHQEIKLGEAGLVTEESKVRANRLMSEEIAIFVQVDWPGKTIEYKIFSREEAKIVRVPNFSELNYWNALTSVQREALEIMSEFLNKQ